MLALGSLLAWMTATTGLGSINRNAFQLGAGESLSIDGPVVLVLGLVLVGIGIARLTRTAMPPFVQNSPVVAALVAAVFLGLDYSSIHDWVTKVTSSSSVLASVGIGYWLCCVGALVALGGGLGLARSGRAEKLLEVSPEEPSEDSDVSKWCDSCQQEIDRNAEFCPKCGTKAEEINIWECTECQGPIGLNDEFCPKCGSPAG
jgi:RNA polymerase subunit RPABC4/transcription elongation factor Spt4